MLAERLRGLLANSNDEADLVLASAAIGALRRPILFLEKADVAPMADELVLAAATLLGLSETGSSTAS